ncbi:hypothetical protein [Massilia horti]|uniref:Uncharacterized protein n=1 Tax=Massilia horti TaxID=2562153 RepID=A0A4Y9T6G9_9BURK|nr:hypothetical protein [Massilia horti]TFW33590.1 hypothetical protein E4O92_06240 [Massilia horti]
MRTNLWDDPRISRICDQTGTSEATVIGGLYWLWSVADEHTESGFMRGLSRSAIDRKTKIPNFSSALSAVGWISEEPDGIMITRFDEHNGTSAKRRSCDARRKAASNVKVPPLGAERFRHESGSPSDLEFEEHAEVEEVVSAAPDGACAAEIRPPCPHQKIIDLYHRILPMCPKVRAWTPARQAHLRARWNEDRDRQNLEYWENFFNYVKSCSFLVGKQSDPKKRPFFADLEWLTKLANFTKIREQKYE